MLSLYEAELWVCGAAGRVNKIGADYIGLLILGVFNAAIGHQNIRAEFQHSAAVSLQIEHPCESSALSPVSVAGSE